MSYDAKHRELNQSYWASYAQVTGGLIQVRVTLECPNCGWQMYSKMAKRAREDATKVVDVLRRMHESGASAVTPEEYRKLNRAHVPYDAIIQAMVDAGHPREQWDERVRWFAHYPDLNHAAPECDWRRDGWFGTGEMDGDEDPSNPYFTEEELARIIPDEGRVKAIARATEGWHGDAKRYPKLRGESKAPKYRMDFGFGDALPGEHVDTNFPSEEKTKRLVAIDGSVMTLNQSYMTPSEVTSLCLRDVSGLRHPGDQERYIGRMLLEPNSSLREIKGLIASDRFTRARAERGLFLSDYLGFARIQVGPVTGTLLMRQVPGTQDLLPLQATNPPPRLLALAHTAAAMYRRDGL